MLLLNVSIWLAHPGDLHLGATALLAIAKPGSGACYPAIMFRIKVCGVTSVEDALAVCQAGGEAIGLNFAPQSARCIGPDCGRAIAAAVGHELLKVGVFVNARPAQIIGIAQAVGLDMLQLHGDEPPDWLPQLPPVPLIKAFRLANQPQALMAVAQYLAACKQVGCLPAMVLLDAFSPAGYGGTGQQLDWQTASQYPMESWYPPLVLAGGLNPANVAQAIATVRPAAVDVASGTESAPGKKDPALIAQFVAAAQAAFRRLHYSP